MYVRYKSSQSLIANGGTYDGDDISLNLNTDVDYINKFIQDYEDKLFKKKVVLEEDSKGDE